MISDARGSHVSPGIYTEERDVTYSVKSLGITNLGLVGETLYGPAFQNIEIEDWTSFVDYFGGTSPEKFKGSGLPKYELPYIAKSYLEKSKQLNVVRVLGLSGYHAGPIWVLKTTSSGNCGPYPLVVFRSKMSYGNISDNPADYCTETEDTPIPVVTNIEWTEYKPTGFQSECQTTSTSGQSLGLKNKFGIKVTVNNDVFTEYNREYIYNLSLNPQDGDYIYKVLSSSPETGSTPLYIEAVYESSLEACGGLNIASGANAIVNLCATSGSRDIEDNGDGDDITYGDGIEGDGETGDNGDGGEGRTSGITEFSGVTGVTVGGEIPDFSSGATGGTSGPSGETGNGTGHTITGNGDGDGETETDGEGKSTVTLAMAVVGSINDCNFTRSTEKVYGCSDRECSGFEERVIRESHFTDPTIYTLDTTDANQYHTWVKLTHDNRQFNVTELGLECATGIVSEVVIFVRLIEVDVSYLDCEYDDYCDAYRPAQTPWFVSEAYASTSGSGSFATTTVTMKKLFKFFTISDGNSSNYQVKISIQRLNPKLGTFDVLVRDFNDTDRNPLILEKFSNCTLNKGDDSYLPFKIGSFDGGYVSKSKYITVLMAEDEDIKGNIPCGYLGYPMPSYSCTTKVFVNYNLKFNPTERVRNQYFGLNETNIDEDILKYKGHYFYDNDTYDDNPTGTTKGFHMDAILNKATSATTYVNGNSGYSFAAVSTDRVSKDVMIPRIINAPYMENTIYKDEKVRKFTCYFYGGFDGWDVNRTYRTNTDKFKATSYAVSGSVVFKTFEQAGINNESINLPSTAITSDYYAYLAGYRLFANPQDIDINLFATPGIDWYNHKLLTIDALEMIEDPEEGRGGDALYVMNAPKYAYVDGDYGPYELTIDELTSYFADDSDINSSYACTYYPWVMYYDSSNKMYLSLPVTKDVVRNMAETDNNDSPWFAPAGLLRGGVECVKADMKTTLQVEDDLYLNQINPVKSFSKDGVKVWGNKTAYFADTPLNRINVRRLMIRVKKLVSDAARHLIFEQYSDTLERQFKGLIEPILAEVKSKRGIYDYRIKTESTPETRDQHILPARILIKPTSALEYISISFVVYPESVEFDEN